MSEVDQSTPSIQEIVVIHRNEDSGRNNRSRLEVFESITKILSFILVPLAIAFGGWIIENGISQRSTSKAYVDVAIDLLTERKDDVSPALRYWAADVFLEHSPTPVSMTLTMELKEGGLSPLPPRANLAPITKLEKARLIARLERAMQLWDEANEKPGEPEPN